MRDAGRRSRARLILAGGLASLALLLGGCVYLRLLAIKNQLSAFDRHFTLDTHDGVRLGCLKPVLLAADLHWLGITPEHIQTLGQSEQWRIRWVKQLPAGTTEATAYDLSIEMIFTEGKLSRVFVPERFFALISKSFFVDLLRGMGAANIDRGARTADVNLTDAGGKTPGVPITRDTLLNFLGRPGAERVEDTRLVLDYRFITTPPVDDSRPIDLAFSFDAQTGQRHRNTGRSRVGKMSFNFAPPPGSGAAGRP